MPKILYMDKHNIMSISKEMKYPPIICENSKTDIVYIHFDFNKYKNCTLYQNKAVDGQDWSTGGILMVYQCFIITKSETINRYDKK